MSKLHEVHQAPASATTQEVTSTATDTLGDGEPGVYSFTVTGPFAPGTADYEDVTVWITFGRGTPTTPVKRSAGYPLPIFTERKWVLGKGVKFKAISDTTTVHLTWSRLSDE